MPSKVVITPAGWGKTQYAIRRMQEVLAAEKLAPIIVILPNQVQVAEFRRRVATSGGALGVNLTTFPILYAELLTRTGQPEPRLPDPVQVRLLRSIVDDVWGKGKLRHYAPLRTMLGFVLALREAIQELKRARINPKIFSEAVKGLGLRLEELADIYHAYQEWLLREGWADSEGQGWLAAIALEEHPNLGSEVRLLVVDGFDEFNPTQLAVLAKLARRARETLITLTGDLGRTRLVHRRFRRAEQALGEALDLERQTIAPPPGYDAIAPLAYLEANLFESSLPASAHTQVLPGDRARSGAPRHGQQSVEFIEAQTRAEEARAALRWIKARLVREGLTLSDVAILARNLEVYRPFLEETAIEFGVPLRIMGGMPLAQNHAVSALLSLLSLPVLDWPRRQVLEAWRSPYFDWSAQGIEREDAAALEVASRQGLVLSGLNQWREAFDLLEARKPIDEMLVEDEEVVSIPLGKSAVENNATLLREKFEAFIARLTPPPQGTMRDYAAFVEDLIGDDPVVTQQAGSQRSRASQQTLLAPSLQSNDAPGQVESLRVVVRALDSPSTGERDLAALRVLKDVLRGLVLAKATLGSDAEVFPYSVFIDELRGAVEAASYVATPRSGVLVASVLDGRGLSFRAMALLGLSEGEFPQVEREDVFLREGDRRILREKGLPLEFKLRGDEVSFFYQAVTRAQGRLLLTRPYLADDGQAWEPSPFWLQAWRLLGKPQPHKVRPEDPLPLEEAASEIEFIQAGGRFVAHLARGVEILQSRIARNAGGPYEGELLELADSFSNDYPDTHTWSASRLEAYGTCPFYFYIANTLNLQPLSPPEEGYDVRVLGSMLHKILEQTFRRAVDPTNLDECLELLSEEANEVFGTAPSDYGFRPTPLWTLQQKELERMLRRTITALLEWSQDYIPRYFEEHFGMDKPPLVIQSGTGEIRLHGFIDRIDERPDGTLRVVDYKAGGSSISPKHLAEGRRLQLPLYALATRQALGLGEVAGGFYWHIGRAEASSLKLEKYDGGVEAAIQVAMQHAHDHVRDIRSGRFQPQSPPDGCPAYCPATQFCWRYKSRR